MANMEAWHNHGVVKELPKPIQEMEATAVGALRTKISIYRNLLLWEEEEWKELAGLREAKCFAEEYGRQSDSS